MCDEPEEGYCRLNGIEDAFAMWAGVVFNTGVAPNINAFLAGWFCRMVEASLTGPGLPYQKSFESGWYAADDHIKRQYRSAGTVVT